MVNTDKTESKHLTEVVMQQAEPMRLIDDLAPIFMINFEKSTVSGVD